jgi:hypothetical protein
MPDVGTLSPLQGGFMENRSLAPSWMHGRAAHAIMSVNQLLQRCDLNARAERAH